MHGLFIRRLCNFEISREFFQIHFSYQLLAQFYYGKRILYDFYFFKLAMVEEPRAWCSLLNVHALWEGKSPLLRLGTLLPRCPGSVLVCPLLGQVLRSVLCCDYFYWFLLYRSGSYSTWCHYSSFLWCVCLWHAL